MPAGSFPRAVCTAIDFLILLIAVSILISIMKLLQDIF